MNLFKTWLVDKYIAHRGLHDDTHPENSISAFINARDNGYAIELDIHALEDNTPVVFHDETLKRLTGQDGYIKNVKNVEELKKITFINSNETIPTFEEVLKAIDGTTPILIEIKDYNLNGNLEKRIYDLLKNYKGEYAVMSFNPYSMRWFKKYAPEITRGILSYSLKDQKMSFMKRFFLTRPRFIKKTCDPHFVAYKWDEVPNQFVKRFKELPLLVWAVQNQSDYMEVAPHCDNIIFENFNPRI